MVDFVDKLGMEDYSRYALGTKTAESFKSEYGIRNFGETEFISSHVRVLDLVPKEDAFDFLFQTKKKKRWAYFVPPRSFWEKRAFFFDHLDMPDLDEERIEAVDCSDEEEKEENERQAEREALQRFCLLKKTLREDYAFLIGRIHEFMQA